MSRMCGDDLLGGEKCAERGIPTTKRRLAEDDPAGSNFRYRVPALWLDQSVN